MSELAYEVDQRHAPCPTCGVKVSRVRTRKRCRPCGRTLPVEKFHHDPARPTDHLDSQCGKCSTARHMRRKVAQQKGDVLWHGWIFGELMENTGSVLTLENATVIDWRSGIYNTTTLQYTYRQAVRFPFLPGDRVVVVVAGDRIGKVLRRASEMWGVAWSDNPSTVERRQYLADTLRVFYPDWPLPDDLPVSDKQPVSCACPFSRHLNHRPAKLGVFQVKCSRCTPGGWWTAMDVLTRKRGMTASDAGLYLNELENDNLREWAEGIWAA